MRGTRPFPKMEGVLDYTDKKLMSRLLSRTKSNRLEDNDINFFFSIQLAEKL